MQTGQGFFPLHIRDFDTLAGEQYDEYKYINNSPH